MSHLLSTESLIALSTLTAMEIVLGIDNIVFIAILTARLPEAQRQLARRIGLALAMFLRIALLLTIAWMMSLTRPFATPLGIELTGKGLILLAGGLFLIAKATREIHDRMEDPIDPESSGRGPGKVGFASVITQIILLDLVFSLDSVITAVGMARHIEVMIAAIVIAVGVMMVFAGAISDFVERHPTLKMLALAFLILIGVVLTADGLGFHVPKGYVYFAMAFSLGVEILNLRASAIAKRRRAARAAGAPS